jgi:hypothetical protein
VVPCHTVLVPALSVSLVTLPVTRHWIFTHCPSVICPDGLSVKLLMVGAAGDSVGQLGTYSFVPAMIFEVVKQFARISSSGLDLVFWAMLKSVSPLRIQ